MTLTPEDVQAMLRADPFKPLQVRLTDGAIHVITHPRLSMVTRQRLIIGYPDPDDARFAVRDAGFETSRWTCRVRS